MKKRWDMSLETKKTLIIRLYQVLYEYSDAEHPLTQSEIIDLLYKNYGVDAERKAIGRNMSCLMEMGADIVNTRKVILRSGLSRIPNCASSSTACCAAVISMQGTRGNSSTS